MSLAIAQSDIGFNSSSPATVTLTVTAGRSVVLLAIAVFNLSGGTITLGTTGGETIIDDAADGSAVVKIGHIVAATGGSTTFSASWGGGASPARCIIVAAELDGQISTVADADARSDDPVGATPYTLALDTAVGDLVLAACLTVGTLNTINNGFSEFEGLHDFGDAFTIAKTAASTTETPSFTANSTSTGGMAAVAYRSGSPPTIDSITPSSFSDGQAGNVAAGGNFSGSGNELWISPIDNKDGETSTAASQFGAASGGTNPTTSTTVTIPASLPTTCVLLLHFTSRDHTSGTAQPTVSDNNSGASWTQKRSTTDRKAQLWWKRYESGLSGKTITISGAVGSLSARLVVVQDAYETGDPIEDITEETNASGNETHAAITPSHAGAAMIVAVYNYANDNSVSSLSAANFGAADHTGEHLSTGGNDSACAVGVWDNNPASSSGSLTWAQTNGTTYSFAYSVRPRTPAGAAIQQTITVESATSITFTAVKSTLALGGNFAFVQNADGLSNASGYPVTLTSAANAPAIVPRLLLSQGNL